MGTIFYDQESDKLADDDLYRYLTEMKKGSLSSRKLKSIPGEWLYCRHNVQHYTP